MSRATAAFVAVTAASALFWVGVLSGWRIGTMLVVLSVVAIASGLLVVGARHRR